MVRMDKAANCISDLRSQILDLRSQIKIKKSNNKPRTNLKPQSTKLAQLRSTSFLINVLIRLNHLIRNPLPSGDRVHWLQFCKTS